MNVAQALAIVLGTLAAEDLTAVTVGLLIRDGRIDAITGLLACTAGIYLGDLGLWLVGRLLGRFALRLPWIGPRVSASMEQSRLAWSGRRAGLIILGSRFVPGSRVPLYVAAGVVGRNGRLFATWTFIAVALWTPLVIFVSAFFSEASARLFSSGGAGRFSAYGVAAVCTLLFLRRAARTGSDRVWTGHCG